jgi:hypothetical protein
MALSTTIDCGQQIVTKPENDMRRISMSLNKLSNQGALADTRLTPDQDNLPPRRTDPSQQVSHQAKLFFPLQKHESKPTEPHITALMGGDSVL